MIYTIENQNSSLNANRKKRVAPTRLLERFELLPATTLSILLLQIDTRTLKLVFTTSIETGYFTTTSTPTLVDCLRRIEEKIKELLGSKLNSNFSFDTAVINSHNRILCRLQYHAKSSVKSKIAFLEELFLGILPKVIEKKTVEDLEYLRLVEKRTELSLRIENFDEVLIANGPTETRSSGQVKKGEFTCNFTLLDNEDDYFMSYLHPDYLASNFSDVLKYLFLGEGKFKATGASEIEFSYTTASVRGEDQYYKNDLVNIHHPE